MTYSINWPITVHSAIPEIISSPCCRLGLASWRSSAEPVFVQQPRSAVREVGGTVALQCSVSETYDNYFEWRRVQSSTVSEQVYSTYNNAAYTPGSGFPVERFRRVGLYGLTITSLTASDGASYACQFPQWNMVASANVFVIGEFHYY